MSVTENKDWQNNWIVDLEAGTATHTNGLVISFHMLPLNDNQMQALAACSAVGKCWSPDQREWGLVVAPGVMDATVSALKKTHSLSDIQLIIARWGREAGEVWVARQKARH